MSGLESLIVSGIVGGTLLVPFVDYVTKNVTNPKVDYAIALLTSVVFGGIVAVLQGHVQLNSLTNPNTVLLSLSTVFITSQTLYKLYWEKSLVREKFNKRFVNPVTEPVQPLAETGTPEVVQP